MDKFQKRIKLRTHFAYSDGFCLGFASNRPSTVVKISKKWKLVEEFPRFNLWERESEYGDIIRKTFSKGINPNEKDYYLI